ncbi:glutathione S-transferase TAU 22 [Striga asiatica]|uniref:Glutathione S-transferase TAU 22 n=1 Tax=Striga asiatica TaxID=4170 RepID=A0A5A7PW16_STRAF|nr:glutathione S-transferase TAU 22 [Striga asiatica]
MSGRTRLDGLPLLTLTTKGCPLLSSHAPERPLVDGKRNPAAAANEGRRGAADVWAACCSSKRSGGQRFMVGTREPVEKGGGDWFTWPDGMLAGFASWFERIVEHVVGTFAFEFLVKMNRGRNSGGRG